MVPQLYMRIKFRKGQQRKFLQKILHEINCPSLRELINRGIAIPYSTLKNYSSEKRNLPKELFNDLCTLAKINPTNQNIKYLDKNFGQILGGQKSKRKVN